MPNSRQALTLLVVAVLICIPGCIRQTITDKQIAESVKAFLDAPPDPSDENALTTEERAAIDSFEIYRSTLKLQLAEGTDMPIREPVGRKVVRAFALACRDAGKLEMAYVVQLYIREVVEDKKGNFLVGEIRFQNASERVYVEMYKPTPR